MTSSRLPIANRISIIIVNYNVRYFLENCLRSVMRASEGLDVEVYVVDNNSSDNSQAVITEMFPWVNFVALDRNVGFSKANNLAIAKATGEYVLLLNPDTVLREDTLRVCLEYMATNSRVGAIGVRMIDGYGNFLPESKRGLPTPAVAFYKMIGLSRLFPRSEKFGRYHLGFLDEHRNHRIDVLSGAFMFMRKKALDLAGYLDETFFMYGEDIDLSYRLSQTGFENHYVSDTCIIHYKGESTKKGSLNYVFVFYRAMIIFAEKHFSKGQARIYSTLINLAIYLRAAIAATKRLTGRFWIYALDLVLCWVAFKITTHWYATYSAKSFSEPFIDLLIPIYAFTLCTVLFLSGAYDRPFRWIRFFRGWVFGLLSLLTLYALLPESYRFSRAVVLMGCASSGAVMWLWRTAWITLFGKNAAKTHSYALRRLVVGTGDDIAQVKRLYTMNGYKTDFWGGIAPLNQSIEVSHFARWDKLQEAIADFRSNELVYAPERTGYGAIIDAIDGLAGNAIEHRLYYRESSFIVGPNTIITTPPYPLPNGFRDINTDALLRNKRLFDLVFCVAIIPAIPVLALLADSPLGVLRNWLLVFMGKLSWVGTDPRAPLDNHQLRLSGIVYKTMNQIWQGEYPEPAYINNINYVMYYSWLTDLGIVFQHLYNLGKRVNQEMK
ncbi:MAG: glycosyltransferase [Salibacteraceae bacterium]